MDKREKEIWKLLELYRNYLTDEIKKEMYVNWADKECIDMFEADEVEEERLYKFLNQLSVLKNFVKWLVENDKINTESWPLYWFHFIMHNRQPYSLYETILMILSISSSPIDDLISYLR